MRVIPFGKPLYPGLDFSQLESLIESGFLAHGPLTEEFEAAFRNLTKSNFSIATSSATASLHLSYFALDLRPGDEVIVPSLTHVATVHAVELCHLRPIFIDCEKNGNINADKIEEKINNKTKAISVVHFLGTSVDLTKILSLTDKYQLDLIEDVALGVDCYSNSQHLGTFGKTGSFSFYPVKHMSTGEGGMLTIQDESLFEKIRLSRAFGVNKTHSQRGISGLYDVTRLGFNYRMSEIEAFLGLNQIKNLPTFSSIRKKNFNLIRSAIKNNLLEELEILNDIDLESTSPYCITLMPRNIETFTRKDFFSYLKLKGVGYSVYYPHPVPRLSYYQEKYNTPRIDYMNAAKISDFSFSLPIGPHVNEDDLEYIVENLESYFKSKHD